MMRFLKRLFGKEVPSTLSWKRDFLELRKQIIVFQETHLDNHFPHPYGDECNVAILLNYHLHRSTELLWAEVNGGLDENYQAELDLLRKYGSQF